jgi:cobalt-zinc-cadmium efflux system outer membrane protein
MESMSWPMAMVRTGPAYTMTDGAGWMLMLGVSIPIWRDRLDAGVREAEAMSAMAHADVAAMARMIEGDVLSAREQVVAARERYLALRDRIVPLARSAMEPILTGYASGQLPLVSVIEAARSLWGAEGELVSARFELGLAWARLYRAAGSAQP